MSSTPTTISSTPTTLKTTLSSTSSTTTPSSGSTTAFTTPTVTCHSYGFFPADAPCSSNKTDHHNIAEMLLKVVLNTIALPSLHLRLLIDVFAQLPNSSMVISSGRNILATCEWCLTQLLLVKLDDNSLCIK